MPQSRGKTIKKKPNSKGSTSSHTLTIPELRHSIEYITSYTERLINSGKLSVKEVAGMFAAEWKHVFGKTLKPKIAESYIRSMVKLRKGKHTRKQRGGMSVVGSTGAPLDYLTRPGVDLPYGNFEKYIDKGFVNPEPAILQDCGKQQGILPQLGMGSNTMNGGGLDAALIRPFVSSTPMSIQHDASMAMKGQPLPPGPESWNHTWTPRMSPSAMNQTYTDLSQIRDLTKDIVPIK